jgi:hypothetical protein
MNHEWHPGSVGAGSFEASLSWKEVRPIRYAARPSSIGCLAARKKVTMRTKRLTVLLLTIALLAITTPARAAERVDTLPTILVANAARFNFALAIKLLTGPQPQLVSGYGHGSYAPGRVSLHFVNATNNQTIDVIAIGETVYVRLGNDTRWARTNAQDQAVPVVDPLASATPDDLNLPVTRIGTSTVNGVPTMQYQVWLGTNTLQGETRDRLTAEGITAITDDYFISQAESVLHKLQSNIIGRDTDLGEYVIEFPFVFSAFNDPTIAIEAPPAADVVAAVSANAVAGETLGGAAFPRWLRPAIAHALANYR